MDSDATTEINDDERREILSEIDEKTVLAPRQSRFSPKRRGFAFPVAVNAGAVILVLLAILVTARIFDQRRLDLQRETASFTSAEGAIIEEMRRESEERLSAKEAEISKVRQELQRIESERMALERRVNETVAARERALRDELSRELDVERGRLVETGRTTSQVSAALGEFQERRLAALEAELAGVRLEAREEIRDRVRSLDAAQAAMREQLQAAQEDRRRLLDEFAEREADLEDELARLAAQRERETLATNRLVLGYRDIERSLVSGNETAALDGIGDMRTALVSGPDAALPFIAERRATDLFILDSLESLVRMLVAEKEAPETASVSPGAAGPADAAKTPNAAASSSDGALASGTAALARQEPEEAFSAYRNALEAGVLSSEQERALEGLEQAFRLAQDLARRTADAQLAEIRRRFETDLSTAEAAAEAAEERARRLDDSVEEQRRRVAELETELEQSRAEAVRARQASSDSAAAARAVRGEAASLQRRIAELEEELLATERSLGVTERALATAEDELAAAKREIAGTEAELAAAEEARAQSEASLAQVRSERSRGTAAVIDELRRTVNAVLREARGSGLPLETSGPASATDVESLARAIGADIRLILAQRQALEVVAPREIRLVGTVVSVSDGSIVLEPLATSSVDIGDMLWIRRRTDNREFVVARAEVHRLGQGRIEARLSESATTPLVLDLVYAEVPSS